MIHHIILSQLRTFTPPATQFGADNEPYMVIQVNSVPLDFQQLTSFLYEFTYPTPASREDLLMASAYLSNINNGAAKIFPPVILVCFSSPNYPARAFITSTLPLIRLTPRKTILIPIWSTVPTACSFWNVSAKRTGLFIM